MYKYLLCWRYLRTRWIALVSIISVTLGVGTMIVVNSVMQGFSSEMENRLHGILSDVVVNPRNFKGVPDAGWHMERIRQVAGDDIEGMTATVFTKGILSMPSTSGSLTFPVEIIGIDEKTQSSVSDFGKYLQHRANREAMSFELREGGYDTRDHQAGAEARERPQMRDAGWIHRRKMAEFQEPMDRARTPTAASSANVPRGAMADGAALSELGATAGSPSSVEATDGQAGHRPEVDLAAPAAVDNSPPQMANPFAGMPTPNESAEPFNMAKKQHSGVVLGIAMASWRDKDGVDMFRVLPGDDVTLTTVTVGQPPQVSSDQFTIVDLYESKMSEYDGNFVFVPISKLQELRGMWDPTSQSGNINSIQIKLKPGVDGNIVRDKLQEAFGPELYHVATWRDQQGPLLSAVQMETAILNLLLFLIIAVAGFGILAIFYMIVVEKTRDIGILKSLGASAHGVMGIFLGYGLALGIVGSGVGMILGLMFVHYINEIAAGLGWITGQPVFDPSIYYFYKIPAIVIPSTVAWIVGGALCIAVMASILPARRAARLHPVEALRYE